jgi:hypothetical protein
MRLRGMHEGWICVGIPRHTPLSVEVLEKDHFFVSFVTEICTKLKRWQESDESEDIHLYITPLKFGFSKLMLVNTSNAFWTLAQRGTGTGQFHACNT